eukprot:m.210432 g.210432  ORF g.210432 m.210432 type:complete len:107 (-) comp25489_c1_seq26:1499-1819(-)
MRVEWTAPYERVCDDGYNVTPQSLYDMQASIHRPNMCPEQCVDDDNVEVIERTNHLECTQLYSWGQAIKGSHRVLRSLGAPNPLYAEFLLKRSCSDNVAGSSPAAV